MPILIGGFGNILLPLMLCSSDMIFPRLNALSLWLAFNSLITILISMFIDGGCNAGWTFYVPLSIINGAIFNEAEAIIPYILLCSYFYSTVGGFSIVMELLIEEFLIHFPLILSLIRQFKLSIESSKGIYSIYLFSFPFYILTFCYYWMTCFWFNYWFDINF